MSKAQAREILELEAGVTDTTLIKTAYKKQSFKYHPDHVSEEDRDRATSSDKFGLIKRAYDTLNSGIRNNDKQSWYESLGLGGRERNEFMGPITYYLWIRRVHCVIRHLGVLWLGLILI